MFPTLLHIGPFTIRTYGLFVAVGFFFGLQYLLRRAARNAVPEKNMLDMTLYAVVAGLLGARLTYVLQNWGFYRAHPADIFRLWEGGLVFFGGFIAGAAAAVWYVRAHRGLRLGMIADMTAPALALGHMFGRLGCFFAGCCYGLPASLPWAVTFCNPESIAPTGIPRHPTQLYEAAANLGLFLFLERFRRRPHREGSVFSVYLVLYGVIRFLIEFLRGDDRGRFIAGLSPSQLVSLLIVAGGTYLFLKGMNNNHEKRILE